jgi:hypothetical protein
MSAALLAGALLAGCGGGGEPDVSVVPQQSSSFAVGNGIGTKPPLEILQAAEAAFRSARSVRVRNSDGGGTARVISDAVMTKDATRGWMLENGTKVQFIRVGNATYLRSRTYWTKQDPLLGKVIGDRWAKLSAEEAPARSGAQYTLGEFADKLLAPLAGPPAPTFKGKTMVTVEGHPAVRVSWFDGADDVAATGKPFPLRLDLGGEVGDFEFSEHDRAVTITAPRGAVDLGKPLTIPAKG